MLTEKNIKLFSFFDSSSLNTRDEAIKLFTFLANDNTADKLIYDFENISFISRSFADEFHKSLIFFTNIENVSYELVNAASDIIEMLQAVSRTQNNEKRSFNNLPVYSFIDTTSLYKFLYSI
jgi:hypothetical protein